MLNDKTISELEIAQNKTISQFNLQISDFAYGIKNKKINLEDGIPWLEVEGIFSKSIAKKILQELANNMNIRVLFNRITIDSNNHSVLYIVLDIDPDFKDSFKPVPSYSSISQDNLEFINDYGKEFLPISIKKSKKPSCL